MRMATVTNRSQPTRSDRRPRLPHARSRTLQLVLLYVGAALFLLQLVWLASNPIGFILPVATALFLVLLITLGPERLGIGLVGVAFFLAPGGIGTVFQFAGPSVLITDLALLGGAFLLLPRLMQSSYRVAPP